MNMGKLSQNMVRVTTTDNGMIKKEPEPEVNINDKGLAPIYSTVITDGNNITDTTRVVQTCMQVYSCVSDADFMSNCMLAEANRIFAKSNTIKFSTIENCYNAKLIFSNVRKAFEKIFTGCIDPNACKNLIIESYIQLAEIYGLLFNAVKIDELNQFINICINTYKTIKR